MNTAFSVSAPGAARRTTVCFAEPLFFSLLLMALLSAAKPARAEFLAGFRRSPWWGEQVLSEKTDDGVRLLYNASANFDPSRPTLLVFYATPNGNTIEQTMGCAPLPDDSKRGPAAAPPLDWHFDIQHIAAQTRRWREADTRENIVLVVVQPEGKSWPAWRTARENANARIRALVELARKRLPGQAEEAGEVRVALSGHSGGGSFVFGFLEAGETIPSYVERIALLDADYSYSDEARHGDKLLAWLAGDPKRHLVVLAYDDRNITLDDKPVVGPEGGTYRATHRMIDRFRQGMTLTEGRSGDLDTWTGRDGQVRLSIDRNPQNRILHTVLVETNGFLYSMTAGTPDEAGWGSYRGARAYTRWIQPCEPEAPVGSRRIPSIPARPADATPGAALLRGLADKPLEERETALLSEVLRGNVPDFLRTFQIIETRCVDARGQRHTARIAVMPDVLAVGSDTDFVRVPLTPITAQRIANRLGFVLPTRRLSDAIFHAAAVKLEPRPLTENREAVTTFLEHNAIIESQRGAAPLGRLVAGHKKDVVLTNSLADKPGRVAIYGWHHADGTPIQPLYTGHAATYVDYSHGIRLLARAIAVDGRPMDIRDVLQNPDLCSLVSDECEIAVLAYDTSWPDAK